MEKGKVSIPSFLSWPPSIAHNLSHWIMRYIVQDGFCPWFRGGCTACSRGRDEFQCGEDVFPSNHVRRTIEILQLPFFLASLVFWLDLSQWRNCISWNPKVHYLITRARHTSPYWARSILTMPPHPNSHRSILIISSNLPLCLPSGLFPSGLPTKTLHIHLLSPMPATCPAEMHREY